MHVPSTMPPPPSYQSFQQPPLRNALVISPAHHPILPPLSQQHQKQITSAANSLALSSILNQHDGNDDEDIHIQLPPPSSLVSLEQTSTYSTVFSSANNSNYNNEPPPHLQEIIDQIVGYPVVIPPQSPTSSSISRGVIFAPAAPPSSHQQHQQVLLDLNLIPPNFAEFDKKHFAHTTLPFNVESPERRHDDDNTPPASTSSPWHPMSSKLSELLQVSDPSSSRRFHYNSQIAGDTDDPQNLLLPPTAVATSTDVLLRSATMNTALMGATTPTESSGASTPSSTIVISDSPPQQQQHDNKDGEDQGDEHHQQQQQQEIFPSVVCSNTDLKSLVTAPFVSPNKPMTLFVHRVGETMFLDAGLTTTTTTTTAKSNRSKTLASKLVYFSIAAATESSSSFHPSQHNQQHETCPNSSRQQQQPCFGQVLRWKFDDLSALIGTQPQPTLVSRETGGRVSLLLQDVEQEERDGDLLQHQQHQRAPNDITIDRQEALDMWLDNVMSNIQHVAVCCHRDGVVQGFHVVPTSKLPSMSHPMPFEPVAVLRHSRDVLKWLQASTQENGSYVLVKDTVAAASAANVESYDEERDQKQRQHQPILKLFKIRTSNESGAASVSTSRSAMLKPRGLEAIDDVEDIDLADGDILDNNNDADVEDDYESNSRTVATNYKRNSAGKVTTSTCPTASRIPEFDFPLALMCFRMAQCLPYTDAEAFRLLNNCLHLLDEAACSLKCSNTSDDFNSFAAIRAVAFVTCAEHLRSTSPLSDSEALCLRYARNAIQPLAMILSASSSSSSSLLQSSSSSVSSSFIPAVATEPDVRPTALRLTKQLLVLLAGVAAVQQRRRTENVECMKTLALAQAVLMLRNDEIPSGLLTMTTATTKTSESCSKGTANDNNNNNLCGEAVSSAPLPSVAISLPDKSILLDITSALDCVVGDLFHSLLTAVVSLNSATSAAAATASQQRETVDAVLKMAAVAAQDVGVNELAPFYPQHCSSTASPTIAGKRSSCGGRFIYPPQVDFLGHLENCTFPLRGEQDQKQDNCCQEFVDLNVATDTLTLVDAIFEAGSASYSRAAALMMATTTRKNERTRTATVNDDDVNSVTDLDHREISYREISRKLAGLESQVALYYLKQAATMAELCNNQQQQQQPQQPQQSSSSLSSSSFNDKISCLLATALTRFNSARSMFARFGDTCNSILMTLNMVKVKLRCAEQVFMSKKMNSSSSPSPSTPQQQHEKVSPEELKELVDAVKIMTSTEHPCHHLHQEAFPVSSSCTNFIFFSAGHHPVTSTTPLPPEYNQLRLQFIQLCVICATRCLTLIGPGCSFDRDRTFNMLYTWNNKREATDDNDASSKSSAPSPLFDPSLHPFRLIINLKNVILNEFLLPADRVARKLAADGDDANGPQPRQQHSAPASKIAADLRARVHLMIAELSASLGCGVRHPVATTSSSSTNLHQQQQREINGYQFLLQHTKLIKVATWAEKEIEEYATTLPPTSTSSSSSSDEVSTSFSLATTHFKLALELGLSPLWRRSVVALYLLDVMIKKIKLSGTATDESTMKALGFLFDTLAPWVEEENEQEENRQQQQQQLCGKKGRSKQQQEQQQDDSVGLSASLILPRLLVLLMNVLKLVQQNNNNSNNKSKSNNNFHNNNSSTSSETLKEIVGKLLMAQQLQERAKRELLVDIFRNALPNVFRMRRK